MGHESRYIFFCMFGNKNIRNGGMKEMNFILKYFDELANIIISLNQLNYIQYKC